MAFHYDTFAVLQAYLEVTKDFSPTRQELEEFDQELFTTYDDLLEEFLPANGIPPTLEMKSVVLVLSKVSGIEKRRLQVKNACLFLREATNALES